MRGFVTTTLTVILEVSADLVPASTVSDLGLEDTEWVSGFSVSYSGGSVPGFDSCSSVPDFDSCSSVPDFDLSGIGFVRGLMEVMMKLLRVLINLTSTRTCTPSSFMKTKNQREERRIGKWTVAGVDNVKLAERVQ